jgi:hypothetical protein
VDFTGSIADATTDVAAAVVLAAFKTAQNAGKPTAECYRAAVEAWSRVHPEQRRAYAALKAVEVIERKTDRLMLRP